MIDWPTCFGDLTVVMTHIVNTAEPKHRNSTRAAIRAKAT